MFKNTKEQGAAGEEIACKYLVKNGFTILDRNYQKKWGELDIVAKYNGILNFIEVKSVLGSIKDANGATDVGYRPEDNVHIRKQGRLRRVIQSYLQERGYSIETDFCFTIAIVVMDIKLRRAKVRLIENVVL